MHAVTPSASCLKHVVSAAYFPLVYHPNRPSHALRAGGYQYPSRMTRYQRGIRRHPPPPRPANAIPVKSSYFCSKLLLPEGVTFCHLRYSSRLYLMTVSSRVSKRRWHFHVLYVSRCLHWDRIGTLLFWTKIHKSRRTDVSW